MQGETRAFRRRVTHKGIAAAVTGAGMGLCCGGAVREARATDLDVVTQRVTAQLLSSLPSTSTVNGYMSSLQANGSWADIDYANTAQTNWVPLTHLQRLESMAELYASSSSALYHNTTLGADISNAYSYWISANPMSTNWFDNDIAAPQALGNTMVLISPILSASQIASGQTVLGRAKADIPHENGQNVVDEAIAGIDSAIVSGSAADMASAFGSIGGTITVVPGNGIQTDFTYQFHGPQLYMGGYGTSYVNDTLNWASIGAGTSYAITSTQEKLLVDYLLNGTQWFIRGQTLDLAADGRQVTFTSYVGAGTGYVSAIDNALALGTYRTAELQAFLARQQATISSGTASSTQNTLSGNRAFFDSDAMVQQRPAYYASVKVVSTRTSQPETGNNQGLENLYLGDGVNQIMVTGNEYLGIQPSWNWRRLPGTTVEQDTRSLTPSGTFGAVKGTTTYAGGVSNGIYGAEAFDYNRFDVAAKKSWFFFDNEEVALGSTIHSSNTTYEVDTTVNQCLLTSTVSYETTANTTIQTLANGTVTPANLKWVFQGGVGYFFLNPVSNATIQAIAQTGKWSSLNTAASSSNVTQNVFTLYINHGTAVSNGAYSYIAVPGITAAGMDAYWASNPIQMLRNDATVQAVRQSALDITEAAFYAADSFAMVPGQTVSASAASTIMLQRHTNTLSISASSPQALQMALQVDLTGVTLSGSGSTWFDAFGTGSAGFNLPGGTMAGSSVGITLVTDGAAAPTVALNSNDGIGNSTYSVTSAVSLPGNTTFQTDSWSTLVLTNSVSGTASITKTGAGTLTLSGANNFNGGVTIANGTVRALNATALGTGATTVNAGATLVVGVNAATAITLAGGSLNFTGSPTLSGTLTAQAGTTSTLQIADPLSPSTAVNVPFTGTLAGSGNITLLNATGVLSPDGGQAFRINSGNNSTFSGTLTLSHNVKGELFGQTSGTTTPAGSGKIVLVAGDAALGGGLNAVTTTAGYSELNVRDTTGLSQVYGNNVEVTGSGLAILNPLGGTTPGVSITMGNLKIGAGQELGVYLSSTYTAETIVFPSVTLSGGTATFSPKTANFGAAGSTGSDLSLGNISELMPGSGIAMTGLRTLILTGGNTFTGGVAIKSGTVQIAGSSAFSASNTVTIGNGASSGTLDLGGFNTTIGGLSVGLGANASAQVVGSSSKTASSVLTIGGGSTFFGGVIRNTLSSGNQTVGLAVTGGSLALSGLNTYSGGTTISNGSLYANTVSGSATGSGNVLLNGGTLGGTGTVAGNVVAGAAPHTIAPGGVTGGVGTLTVGSLSTNANTTLSFDLASPSTSSDLLAITGNLSLNGGAIAIASQSSIGLSSLGYYRVMSYGGTLTGSTAPIALPAAVGNVVYTLDASHDAGFVDIHRGLLGDANDDGGVDLNDLNVVLNHLGTVTSSWTDGNFDGASTIDLNDLNAVLNALGTSVPAGASATLVAEALIGTSPAATPEPASALMLALSIAALGARRRRR